MLIDQVIDAVASYEVLCFLDAYKGYHQIPMAPEDMENTAFVTDNSIFCYTRMPFGLKTVHVEFQEMVNDIFGEQIGRNMEIYVDDIILKSKKVERLPQVMKETFSKIRQVRMHLNPKKRVFNVPTGKCLRFIISERGFEANPEKIRAIQLMTLEEY